MKLQYQEEMLRRATENVQRKKQAVVQQTLPKTAAQVRTGARQETQQGWSRVSRMVASSFNAADIVLFGLAADGL